ncbi:hypothetical protein PHET_09806 [Paragonimus heterotremus]|uniref:Uncharacterized protein n=1 Tax=Paragonimus heterotremus TaxID=100268 RepID=A0A8J4WN76_9TREM|nr:hypothetical protein PHET_09806 [Paragonimus heterotremus]
MLAGWPTMIPSTAIPSLSVSSSWKILGVSLDRKSRIPTIARQDASRMLQQLNQALLKPQQHVEILRSPLIPRLFHQLTLGVVHKKTLKSIDSAVKSVIRKSLRPPNDTSNAFFHSAINVRGMGIPHLQSRIHLNRKLRTDRHLANQNQLLHWALRHSSGQPFHRLVLKTTIVGGEVISVKEQTEVARKNSLWNTLDGTCLRDTPTVPQSHNYFVIQKTFFQLPSSARLNYVRESSQRKVGEVGVDLQRTPS